MTRLSFYFRYALRDIRRGGRWMILAMLCITAGVATVVALRSLGLAIGDALVENVRFEIKGDLLLYRGSVSSNRFGSGFSDSTVLFQPEEIDAVQRWADVRDARISTFAALGALSIAPVDANTTGRPQLVGTYLIDPHTYPPSHDIVALEPAGVPLADLFTGGTDIVISQNMAQQQHIEVGDQVRIAGTSTPFTVRGIVDAANEANIRDILNAFFGFVYIDMAVAQQVIDETYGPNAIAIQFAEPPSQLDVDAALWQLRRLMRYPTQDDTALSLLARNAVLTQVLGDFIVVMGLGALLIGGVGIMNTMLVMVRRRTIEIAALKTMGLKNRQISMLFFTEGLLLGLMGSVCGIVAGVLLGGVVNSYGEAFLQQALPWRIYPEALLYGFALGMVTTVIFGVAPILTALQIRPAIILRPNETPLPRLGLLQSAVLLIVVTLAIGVIAGQILRTAIGFIEDNPLVPYLTGIFGVGATLLLLGFVTLWLWLLVWGIGKLPSLGQTDIRLALRNLSSMRLRTATTLLALSAGMFALSSIAFIGQGAREALNLQLRQQLGGNILAFPTLPGTLGTLIADRAVGSVVDKLEGVQQRTRISTYQLDLIAIDGQPLDLTTQPINNNDFLNSQAFALTNWEAATVWDTDNAALLDTGTIQAGRNLTLADRTQPVIVGGAGSAAQLGIQVGSVLTYRAGSRTVDVEVIGLSADLGPANIFSTAGTRLPPDVLRGVSPLFTFYTYEVADEHVNEALLQLSGIRIPPTFALDITFIDSLLKRLIDQFAAIPTLVGLLSLVSAAVIMANTVALSTLERRKQIGVLKAIGLSNARVLRIMLIESTLVGLLSALVGLGFSALFVALFTGLTGTPIPLPREAQAAAVWLLVAAIGISWLATLLNASLILRERVMAVLRND